MHCQTKKADIFPLPTLAYNKSILFSTLDILQKLKQELDLSKEVLYKKIIMLKADLLIVKNAM